MFLTYNYEEMNTAASKHFAYDTQDRLSGISLSVPSQGKTYTDYKTYRYDANGNITQYSVAEAKNKVSKPTRTISNEADQLISQIYADRRLDVVYDDEGNITRLTKRYTTGSQAQSTTRYRYNYLGQIQDIEKDGTTIAEYGYASDGLRVYSHTYPNKADTERRPYEGQKVYYYDQQGRNIGEGKPELGHCTVKYIYKGNEKIAMIRPKDATDRRLGEEIYYFINNAQGTPVRIEDGVGQAVAVPQVDEWGQVSRPGLGSGAEINYTGKKYDPATGLTYFGARYYMPELGVFLTPDPAQQTLNPYLYAGNSPLVFVDPDGEWFGYLFGMMPGAISEKNQWTGKMFGAGIGLIGKDLKKEETWDQFADDAIFLASTYVNYWIGHGSGLTGMNKSLAHGGWGGIRSMASGGKFESGFASGFVGDITGNLVDGWGNDWTKIGVVGFASGTTSWASGGDFGQGFVTGASIEAFNHLGRRILQAFSKTKVGDRVISKLAKYDKKLLDHTFGQRSVLFKRQGGLLNNNDYLRIGWNYKGTKKSGFHVFRVAIGKQGTKHHKHLADLWKIPAQ